MAPRIDGICELTLETTDIDASVAFYTGPMGLRELEREDDRVWLEVGERVRLGLWRPGPKEFGDEGGRHVHFAFSAAPVQLDDLRARLRDAGHDVRGPVEHEGGDRSIYVRDPAGHVVEVWDVLHHAEGRRDGMGATAG